ncbi:hypothetical protein HW126_09280 [Salinispora sp. H7-4]|nr:hypothetical protein [Salinispora sp. H7-4]
MPGLRLRVAVPTYRYRLRLPDLGRSGQLGTSGAHGEPAMMPASGQTAARPMAPVRGPRPGDAIRLDRRASPQFVRPITVRVIRVLDRPTYDGWLWLEGYELNDAGTAVRRRQLYVRCDGIVLYR